jgi:hypothetical protein
MNSAISHITEERAIFCVSISDGAFSSHVLSLITGGTTGSKGTPKFLLKWLCTALSYTPNFLECWRFFPKHSQIYSGT